ncbi:UMP-CMP kinase 2, mitochondrial-like [Macrosteles quadrilineatus]|uniref:UMP-CMP kinase 2, mitochondrial-like n=1 Tax=Macrosteles quadrilineatus TaxID=74068 RepID=UPI0023E24142|nr:UMP-CMP kinase 2, mitochondrial-like [Macrosteles quadrilineatus]
MNCVFVNVFLLMIFSKCLHKALHIHAELSNEEDERNLIRVRRQGGYMSLPEALSEFMDPKVENDENVQGFLAVYRTNCPIYFGKFSERKVTSRHIFVVVEGTHRATRNLVTSKLAERLKAANLHSPPGFLTRNKIMLNETNQSLKRAFFMLGIYGVAHTVRDMIPDLSIVTSGYYIDQLAFSIAGAFQQHLPSRSSAIFKWPKDLVKPDIVFFINTPSLIKKRYIELDTFRGRIVQIYRNWETPPPIVEINSTNVYTNMVDQMMDHIHYHLGYHGEPAPVDPDNDINTCFQYLLDQTQNGVKS